MLNLRQYSAKFSSHKSCETGNMNFSNCHVSGHVSGHIGQGCETLMVSHHLAIFGDHWSSAIGNMNI